MDNMMREITSSPSYLLLANKFTPTFVGFLLDRAVELKTGRLTNMYIPEWARFQNMEYFCGLKVITNEYDNVVSYYTHYGGSVNSGQFLVLLANCQHGILGKITL